MKEYLKMADVFKGELFIDSDCDDVIVDDLSLTVLESFSGSDVAKFALHAISSHDELVENMQHYKQEAEQWEARATKEASMVREFDLEIERLRKSLKWAIGNLPFEHPFEWSDEGSHDAHKEAIIASGGTYED